jgi:hypothetical protein
MFHEFMAVTYIPSKNNPKKGTFNKIGPYSINVNSVQEFFPHEASDQYTVLSFSVYEGDYTIVEFSYKDMVTLMDYYSEVELVDE